MRFVQCLFELSISYFGIGYILHAILEINQQKLTVLKGAMISMASASIGLIAGGWVGGAAATYTWVRRDAKGGDTAALAGTLPSLLNNGVLVIVALIGTLYLLLLHDLSKAQLIEFGLILLVLAMLATSLIFAFRNQEKSIRFAVWLAGHWTALRHKPFTVEDTIASVKLFYTAWASMKNGRWLRPVVGAVANVGFDMLTLYFVFVAVGHRVSLGILLAGYGLPLTLGKVAFLLPGGVGVVEGGMVALYNSLQVPNELSVVVVLGYRLISFWLPTILGFAAAAFLSRKPSFLRRR